MTKYHSALLFVIFFLLAFIILRITSCGWRFGGKTLAIGQEDVQLVKSLQRHVYILSHEIGDRSIFKYNQLKQAADYIADSFKSSGYQVTFQEYEVLGKPVKNIIATKIGTKNPDQVIIVGAHYDTCYNPGADDNASAVAGLLELAKSLANQQTNCTIKFIAFVNEEPPFFKTENMGSLVYAKEAKARGEEIKAAIILEMIGYYSNKINSQHYPPFFGFFYPNKGNFIGAIGNFKSRWLVKKIVESFKKQVQFPIESVSTFPFIIGVDFSDHWPFWKEGYPAVMITDTGFYRNRNYHSKTDTFGTLNYIYMSKVIEGLRGAIAEMAN